METVMGMALRLGMHLGGKSISAAELRAARLYAIAKFNEDKPKKLTPEELKRNQKKYRTTNREAIIAQRKVYYEQNGDQLRAAKREAYRLSKENGDHIRIAKRAAYRLSKEGNRVT
jgi:hypothetical protein